MLSNVRYTAVIVVDDTDDDDDAGGGGDDDDDDDDTDEDDDLMYCLEVRLCLQTFSQPKNVQRTQSIRMTKHFWTHYQSFTYSAKVIHKAVSKSSLSSGQTPEMT